MAAPSKQGLDYYPREIDLLRDRRLRRARMKHGYIVAGVYDALLDLVYRDKGYYLDYSNPDDVVWEVQQYLFGGVPVDENQIPVIIADLVASGLFDEALFAKGILTSRDIQRVFYKVTASRRHIEMDFSLWLLEKEEMRELSSRSVILDAFEDQSIMSEDQSIMSEDQSNNPQSKGKEREKEKGNRNREGEESFPPPQTMTLEEELLGTYGKEVVDIYMAKAKLRGYTGQAAAERIAIWIREDDAQGKLDKYYED